MVMGIDAGLVRGVASVGVDLALASGGRSVAGAGSLGIGRTLARDRVGIGETLHRWASGGAWSLRNWAGETHARWVAAPRWSRRRLGLPLEQRGQFGARLLRQLGHGGHTRVLDGLGDGLEPLGRVGHVQGPV